MFNQKGKVISRRGRTLAFLATLLVAACIGWAPSVRLDARPEAPILAMTNQITYNAGDAVRVKLMVPAPPADPDRIRYLFNVRYRGDEKPVAQDLSLGAMDSASQGYHLLWKIPLDAREGSYEVDLTVKDPASPQANQSIRGVCSFVVHRQIAHFISVEVGQRDYTSGDTIGCSVKIENLGGKPLAGLRLEFSERYWPWIAQQTAHIGSNIAKLQDGITLKPHQVTAINSPHCAVARGGDEPSIKQYAAVLWDHDRKNVFALAFTPLVFIDPPGIEAPRPYPSQYTYPSLDKVDTTSYRHFHPEPFDSSAIQFDTRHTQFPSGAEAAVKFTIANPSDAIWRQVTVRVLLLGPDDKEVGNQVVVEKVDLNPHGPKLTQEVKFSLPVAASGLFHAVVEITDGAGQVHAHNTLELGVNSLPKSVLVFCAHEDDDSTQMGFIRSMVENQLPVRIVYFTSGDAGGCDRYYQRSCGPAEALNFGAVRMQESRAALEHLGVPQEDILFLGLPDGASGKIWYEHLQSSGPYQSIQLASDHAPYQDIVKPNLPYSRDAVVSAAEEIIKKFQPEVIFTVHPPAEGHIDHIVNNYFVVKALQEMLRDGAISPDMELRVDRIFDPKGHPATPYHYEDHGFYVSGDVMALAQEAIWFYQSQEGNQAEGDIRTWNQLPRTQGYRKVLDWKEHEGWNEKE